MNERKAHSGRHGFCRKERFKNLFAGLGVHSWAVITDFENNALFCRTVALGGYIRFMMSNADL